MVGTLLRPVLSSARRPIDPSTDIRFFALQLHGDRIRDPADQRPAVQKAGATATATVTHSLSDVRANAGGHVPEMNLSPLCPSLRQTSVRHYVSPRPQRRRCSLQHAAAVAVRRDGAQSERRAHAPKACKADESGESPGGRGQTARPRGRGSRGSDTDALARLVPTGPDDAGTSALWLLPISIHDNPQRAKPRRPRRLRPTHTGTRISPGRPGCPGCQEPQVLPRVRVQAAASGRTCCFCR